MCHVDIKKREKSKVRKGKIVKSDGIKLLYEIDQVTRRRELMSFGTLETDEVMVNEMKDKVKKEYHKRVRKFFGKKFK